MFFSASSADYRFIMPVAAVFTLISLGVFILAAIYTAALTLFSLTRLYIVLVFFSIVSIAFSAIQTLHILNPDSVNRILGVQISYILIVLVNPVLLYVILEPEKMLRRVLIGLFSFNAVVVLVILITAVIKPVLLLSTYIDGRVVVGSLQYVRASVSLFNWIAGFMLMLLFHKNKNSRDVHGSLIIGYLILSFGSLFDAILVALFVDNYRMLLGFYPGMLSGLLFFYISVTLSLSYSYRDREIESENSFHAMEESKKELMLMAYYDEMTGRPNRKSFMLHLNNHLIETISLGKIKAVFIIDLDNFKDVNDTFGFSFGDLVIKDVGDKIENRFGVRDRLYRLYGNQFAIIWDDVGDRGNALDLARQILEDLTSLVEIDNSNLYLGVSLGAVILPDDGDDVNDVFRRCETALAEAKKDRNTYFFYSSELESRTLRNMSIANALREALKKDQFHVVYQPIVNGDGSLAEMEALTRCSHPVLKDVSPEVFISVAESSGLIIPLTWWMMDRVVSDALLFSKENGIVRINVNMSSKILKSRDLIERFSALNKRSPINGSLLGFEITEGAIIENVDQVVKNLRALRERGYRISLDDFGTGYSSLSYIKNLPLDKIKIDKRFVSGISRDVRDEALINSIISIAKNLKMDLVAEGVEMLNQLVFLNDRGCQYFQGYLFSKPVPIDEILQEYPGN